MTVRCWFGTLSGMPTLSAEAQQQGLTPLVIVIIVLIIAGIIYTFGYARAVFHRANSDYKKTKEGLPGMRKTVWQTAWRTVKVGFGVLILLGILIFWGVRDAQQNNPNKQPVPATVSSPPR